MIRGRPPKLVKAENVKIPALANLRMIARYWVEEAKREMKRGALRDKGHIEMCYKAAAAILEKILPYENAKKAALVSTPMDLAQNRVEPVDELEAMLTDPDRPN